MNFSLGVTLPWRLRDSIGRAAWLARDAPVSDARCSQSGMSHGEATTSGARCPRPETQEEERQDKTNQLEEH